MRHKGVKKEETQAKILDAASRGFRKHGYSGIGIDGLAKSAGVTSGAFYSHLGSKKAAFEKALGLGLDEVIIAIPKMQEQYGSEWIKHFCEYYLNKAHREDLECGCAMASLTSEVVRSDTNVQKIFREKMNIVVSLIAKGLTGGTIKVRTEKAWTMLSILTGGLNLVRAMNDDTETEKIAKTFINSAIKSVDTV